jgi:hypothetical protein
MLRKLSDFQVEVVVPYGQAVSHLDPSGDWIRGLELMSKARLFVEQIPDTLGDISVIMTGDFRAVRVAQRLLATFVQT